MLPGFPRSANGDDGVVVVVVVAFLPLSLFLLPGTVGRLTTWPPLEARDSTAGR